MGSLPKLNLPDDFRSGLLEHLQTLRMGMIARGSGVRTGFGDRPALIVVDLGEQWVDRDSPVGADLEGAVETTVSILNSPRRADIPIFFTMMEFGEDDRGHLVTLSTCHAESGGLRGSQT